MSRKVVVLPAPVGPEQDHEFSAPNLHRELAHGFDSAEAFTDWRRVTSDMTRPVVQSAPESAPGRCVEHDKPVGLKGQSDRLAQPHGRIVRACEP